ncbi:MAG: hypothetical protein ACRD3W_04300, partial [Terriglobales bacterium]
KYLQTGDQALDVGATGAAKNLNLTLGENGVNDMTLGQLKSGLSNMPASMAKNLNTLIAANGEDATLGSLRAAAGTDAELAGQLENFFGATGPTRAATLYQMFPTMRGMQLVAPEAEAASTTAAVDNSGAALGDAGDGANAAAAPSRMDRFVTGMKSLPGNTWNGVRGTLSDANPWNAVDTGSIASKSQFMGTRLVTGFSAGAAYNVPSVGLNAAMAGQNPLTAIKDNITQFTDPNSKFLHLNLNNALIQSAFLAPLIGNIKVGPDVYRGPAQALSDYSANNPGFHPIGWGKTLFSSQVGAVGSRVFDFINPAQGGTAFGAARQMIGMSSLYFAVPKLATGYMMNQMGQPFQDALDRIGKPIENQSTFVIPTIDPTTGQPVGGDGSTTTPAKPATTTAQNQPGTDGSGNPTAPANATPGAINNTNGPNVTGG